MGLGGTLSRCKEDCTSLEPSSGSFVPGIPETQDEIHPERKFGTILELSETQSKKVGTPDGVIPLSCVLGVLWKGASTSLPSA